MEKKYKGTAIIELTDKRTGKKRIIKEENMVTNYIKNLFTKNIFGAVDYRNFWNDAATKPTAPWLMSGIMLFPDNITEGLDNFLIPKDPTAWAGNSVNTSGGTARGSFSLAESEVTSNGFKLVWEWSTAQGNGTYQCLALTNPLICNSDVFANGKRNTDTEYVNRIFCDNERIKIRKANTEYANTWYNPVYIDTANGIAYGVEITQNGTGITVYKARRGVNKIPTGQVNLSTSAPSNTVLEGVVLKDYETASTTVATNITSNYNSRRPTVSISYYDGYIWIFKIQHNSNSILITKLDLSTFNNGSITATQSTYTISASGVKFTTDERNYTTDSLAIMKDSVCFAYPHLIVRDYSTAGRFIKININDASEYSYITAATASDEFPSIQNFQQICGGVLMGNYYYKDCGYLISLADGTYKTCYLGTNRTGDVAPSTIPSTNGQNLNNIDNMFIYGNTPFSGYNVNTISYMPFYLATINNVTSFTKTAADFMKITYMITEQ